MKINRDANKFKNKIVKISSLVGIILTLGGGKVMATSNLTQLTDDQENFFRIHSEFQNQQLEYYKNVQDANLENFDTQFVDLYREGKFIIREKEYSMEELYILFGKKSGIKDVCLISYNNPDIDILTNVKIDNFERSGILEFRNSQLFYDIYKNYGTTDNELEIFADQIPKLSDMFLNSDGTIHNKVPETYYLDIPEENKIKF